MHNALNLSNPPAVWELWQEPAGERIEYYMPEQAYLLARHVLAAAWTTGKPSQLPAVVLFAEHNAQSIVSVRVNNVVVLNRKVA